MLKGTLVLTALSLLTFSSYAATIDGSISSTNEYRWNTTGAEGSDKWVNFSRNGRANKEYNDASGGNDWDINYLGTSVSNGEFQFGAIGGKILSGRKTGNSSTQDIFLSDIAIGVNISSNPTIDSTGFKHAVRLTDVNDITGVANFELLSGGTWEGADIYNGAHGTKHQGATYKMINATSTQAFSGIWKNNGSDKNVLEGGFDLSWLSLFDPSKGGTLSTYLTMACINDEAIVHAAVSAVPIPAAIWLLSPALLGFISFRRKKNA